MKILIDRETKIALLKALQTNVLDTEEIPVLQTVLNEARPDLWLASLSDEQLDARIEELQKKLEK